MINNRVVNEKYKYSDLTAKIIGAAMEVHKFLGNGFQEVIYQRALCGNCFVNSSRDKRKIFNYTNQNNYEL